MSSSFEKEMQANLRRADESLRAANQLNASEYYDAAASRAYYAAFYVAVALLLSEGLEFSKHSGVIAAVHQNFVKSGKLDKESGKNLNWLFELRGVADYGETLHVSKADAHEAVKVAEAFITKVKKIIKFGNN